MEKIAREITSNIEALKLVSRGSELAAQIEASVETRTGETVLIVGKNGAGKSTFVERFFDLVLDPAVKRKCFLISVDLLDAAGDEDTIIPWLINHMVETIEAGLFEGGAATYEELQGLYYGDYNKWRKGEFRPLYENDKNAFKQKFGEYLHEKRNRDREGYLHRLLRDIVNNRSLMPCLVFDNADNFPQRFQEGVFQFAQSLNRASDYSFLIMPVTDRTIWKLSKEGPFQTYASKAFYLPVPSSKDVIERRISYLRSKIDAEDANEDTKTYLLSKGIRVKIADLQGFAAALEEVFISTDFVSRRIGWLANHNIRRSLELARRVMTSAVLSVDDLVSSYLARKNVHVGYERFMQSLLLGDYNYFNREESSFVCNVFDVDGELFGSPLTKLSILKLLIDKVNDYDNASEGYLTVRHIRDYLEPLSISDIEVDRAISTLLEFRLVEPYDPSDDSVHSDQRVAITYSGRMHAEMALTDPVYLSQMAICSSIRDFPTVEIIRNQISEVPTEDDWGVIRSRFIQYCLGEDSTLCRIPTDAMYDGQRQIRDDLRAKWVAAALEKAVAVDAAEVQALEQAGKLHVKATVLSYNEDQGYGFVRESGTNVEAFVHISCIQQLGFKKLTVGDQLTCDIAKGHKGFTVVTVHTIEPITEIEFDDDDYLEAKVTSYYPDKHYGFVFVSDRNQDVFFHGRLFEETGRPEPDQGDNLQVILGPGSAGKQWQVIFVKPEYHSLN